MIFTKRRHPLMRIHHSKEFSDQSLRPYLGNLHNTTRDNLHITTRDNLYNTTRDNHVCMGSKSPMIYKRKMLANQTFSIDKAMKLSDFIKQVQNQKKMSQSNISKNKENTKKIRNSSQFDRYNPPTVQLKTGDQLESSNTSIGYKKNIRKLCRRKEKYRSQLKLTQLSPWSNKHQFFQYQCLQLYDLKD